MVSLQEIEESVKKAQETSENGVTVRFYYEMVELHTLNGKVFIRADRIVSIGPAPMPKESGGKTMVVTQDNQYYWTDESQESIAKKVEAARLAIITEREIPSE